jgi:putative membrane protein insertion efficiency factor
MLPAILIFFLRVYKLMISPYLPLACRYEPTCSVYMIEAIKIHGAWKGVCLGLKRIARCHPWGGFGYDPVPPKKSNQHQHSTSCSH